MLFRYRQVTGGSIKHVNVVNAPCFNFEVNVRSFEIAYVNVSVDRRYQQELKAAMRAKRYEREGTSPEALGLPHMVLQPEDLNTDGIDPSGKDIWIHDCNILNDDDSIAVKPSSGDDEFGTLRHRPPQRPPPAEILYRARSEEDTS